MLDYDLIGSRATYLYFDGTPLYPFGHGLSYTSFAYSDLTSAVVGEGADARLTAEVTVTNTGPRAGDEVVQLYARATEPSVPRPHHQLVAHRRVHLALGEARRLTFAVPVPEALGFWDVGHSRWAVEPGTYELQAGASSGDIRAWVAVTMAGEPVPSRPVLDAGLAAADFDESHGIELVDFSKSSGDSAAPASDDEPGTLVFRSCDLGDGPGAVTVLASAVDGTVPAEVELSLPGTGFRVTRAIPPTGDRYAYTTVRQELPDAPAGVRDLTVTLRGGVRLHRVDFA
jgi:beta-glucosidase